MAPNIPRGPKFSKRMRPGAIIESGEGVVLVADTQDKFKHEVFEKLKRPLEIAASRHDEAELSRLEAVLEFAKKSGRYSLPGGGIEIQDYETANATSLLNNGRPLRTEREFELFREVVRATAKREVEEELGLIVTHSMLPLVDQIIGRERIHIFCVMHVEGIVKISEPKAGEKKEISGIGFLNDGDLADPLLHHFYQDHIQQVMSKYIQNPERLRAWIPKFLSHMIIPDEYAEAWYADLKLMHDARKGDEKKKSIEPIKPTSSPTLLILNKQNEPQNVYQFAPLTRATRARIVPMLEQMDERPANDDNSKRRSTAPPPPDSSPTKPTKPPKPGLAKTRPHKAPGQKKKIEVS